MQERPLILFPGISLLTEDNQQSIRIVALISCKYSIDCISGQECRLKQTTFGVSFSDWNGPDCHHPLLYTSTSQKKAPSPAASCLTGTTDIVVVAAQMNLFEWKRTESCDNI